MLELNQTRLESLEVGAVPIINSFLQRLQAREIIDRHLPPPPLRPGRAPALSPATIVLVLLRNILLSRQPMYAIPQWLQGFVPGLFDLTPPRFGFFMMIVIGGTLDRLFLCTQPALLTDIILQAIRAFGIDLSQFHQDTTSVTVHGEYRNSTSDSAAPHITFGYNKDHRPDLKQLIWSLVVSGDGAVPVHFHLHPGNTSDDQLHQQTWLILRQLAGTSDFCYVADCKLASSENMRFIADQNGTFLTILPRTRKEIDDFADYSQQHPIPWQEVRRNTNPRRKDGPDSVYHGWESQAFPKAFVCCGIAAHAKLHQDQEQRSERLAAARLQLKQLQQRANGNTTVATLEEASDKILKQYQVEAFLQVTIERQVRKEFKQQGPGRPGPNTVYDQVEVSSFVVKVAENGAALQAAACWDGLFPLITNSPTFTLKEALDKYKYQPFLEKRHQQLKSVLRSRAPYS